MFFVTVDEKVKDAGPRDLIMEIPELGTKIIGTTADLVLPYEDFDYQDENEDYLPERKFSVAIVLNFWKHTVRKMKDNETRYLPLLFEEEGMGCFKVIKEKNELRLAFGFTSNFAGDGLNIDRDSLEHFSKSVHSFEVFTMSVFSSPRRIFQVTRKIDNPDEPLVSFNISIDEFIQDVNNSRNKLR
ncbi:hypothetical protein [Caldalkalibacillus salinus]|uniref:hypothetical protein n=1 Tax=Caldalkalibacillus salinus TaxID=2803787 RepID=UPI00192451C9|nr:hypothetical protein [Caldalkalibacillus salinus]